MKSIDENTTSVSTFWKIIIQETKRAIQKMDELEYTEETYKEEIEQMHLPFLALIGMMRFVAYEEDLVDGKKKSPLIEEVLSKSIIDKFVFNDEDLMIQRSSDALILLKSTLNPPEGLDFSHINQIDIKGPYNVKEDPIHDSRWVLGVIKKCLAHGNFSFDHKRWMICIENKEPNNELVCDIGIYWLSRLGNLLKPNRQEILVERQLFLHPYLFNDIPKSIKSKNQLINYLNSEEFICYLPLLSLEGTTQEKLRAKRELSEFWDEVCINQDVVEKIPHMTKCVENGRITLFRYGSKAMPRIIYELECIRDFYSLSKEVQTNMLASVMYDIFCMDMSGSYSKDVDYGLYLLSDQTAHIRFFNYLNRLIDSQKPMESKDPEIFFNLEYRYGNYKKKLALCYILGFLLYSGSKETIFDKDFDYDSIDLSKIEAHDLPTGKQIANQITQLNIKISQLEKRSSTNDKVRKIAEQKKEKLKECLSQLTRTHDGKHSVRPSNKEIFHRLRNAFSHKQMHFDIVVDPKTNEFVRYDYDTIVIYDEEKFIAYVSIDDLLDILMNNIFIKHIQKYEEQKRAK